MPPEWLGLARVPHDWMSHTLQRSGGLIVLNIGLQARILSTRTFAIFVVMALITTFATTPLVVWLYPPWYQRKLERWKQGEIDWDGNRLHYDDEEDESSDFSNPKTPQEN